MKTQTLFNAKTSSKQLKFHNCVSKHALKNYLAEISIFSNLVFVIQHDGHLVNEGMSKFLSKMNLLPSILIILV